MIIIGLVLIGGLGAAWYFYSTSNSTSKVTRPATNVNKPAGPPANVPVGANPPNLAGSPTAMVTVEEFADYQCPTCGTTAPILAEVRSIYGNRIKFIFRNFPLSMHDKSYDAAVAAEAAREQGKFWDMQNMIFANQKIWAASSDPRQIWNEYAQKLGMNVDKFQSDMAGLGSKSRVEEDLKRGRAMNINSTPTVLINGVPVDSKDFTTVSGLKVLIDAELQKVSAAAAQAQAKAPETKAANSANSNK